MDEGRVVSNGTNERRQILIDAVIAKLGTVPTANLVMTSSGDRDPAASALRGGLALPNAVV